MKKLLFLLAIALPLVFTSCSKDDDSEPQDKYLQEITVREHQYKFGSVSTIGDVYEDYFYDAKGNLLKKKTNYYNAVVNGRISHEYAYKYDNNNRIIEKK